MENGDVLSKEQFEQYVQALIEGERGYCVKVVNDLLEQNVPIKRIYTGLFTRSLYQVGLLWESNIISVAREHLATSITESLFSLVYDRLFSVKKQSSGKKAVVCCSANEYHQIGGKIVADMFELNGVDSFFLGANTPTSDLLDMVDAEKPDYLAVSVAMKDNLGNFKNIIDRVEEQKTGIDIIAGGQAFSHLSSFKVPQNVKVLDINGLEEYIEN
jgi:methanogenic corrinoid protein MtbC1